MSAENTETEAAAATAAAAAATTTTTPATPQTQRKEVFVRGLSLSTRELALARHIETVAPVEDVRILVSYNSHRSKGSAFVTLKDANQIDEVVEKLNGKPLDGRYLEIQRAKPLSELPPRPRIIYAPYPGPYRGRYSPFYRRGGGRFASRGGAGRATEYRPKRDTAAPSAPAAAACCCCWVRLR